MYTIYRKMLKECYDEVTKNERDFDKLVLIARELHALQHMLARA